MPLLIMRVQNAKDDGTTHAEWTAASGKLVDLDQVCFEAANHGFEIRPNFGPYDPKAWPLTCVFYVGARVKGNALTKYGRQSSVFAWPCRKVQP